MPPPDDNLANVLSRLADVLDRHQGGTFGGGQIVDVNRQGVEAINNLAESLSSIPGFTSPIYTVATLPAAATAGAAARAFVSNANATTFASIVAGGGANFVPVYSDATNWRIG